MAGWGILLKFNYMNVYAILGFKFDDPFFYTAANFFGGVGEEDGDLLIAKSWEDCVLFRKMSDANEKRNELMKSFPDYGWYVMCLELSDDGSDDVIIDSVYNEWESVCDRWIKIFCEKQQLEFDGWIGDEIGGVASFSCTYFFNLLDIILDITTKQEPEFILRWQEEYADYAIAFPDGKSINYLSYTKGARFDML